MAVRDSDLETPQVRVVSGEVRCARIVRLDNGFNVVLTAGDAVKDYASLSRTVTQK
jgi:hypothetical protein